MYKSTDVKLLENLLKLPSPSGFELSIAQYIAEELKKIVNPEQIIIDSQYNVIVSFDYGKEKTVLIDAHSDEIGFIISNVDRWGRISIQYIGGGDSTILTARHLDILTENGIVPAVIDRKHAHLVQDETTELILSPEQADVDIGLRNRTQILKKIQIGDPIVYQHSFRPLTSMYYAGYGFDDKAGCFMLIQTIQQLIKSKRRPTTNLFFVFSTQEETGKSKLFPVVRKYKPNLVIEADVTFATDYGDVDGIETEVGRCNLGEGIVLYRGVDIDNRCWTLAEGVAQNKKIPYQIQASNGGSGYNSLEITGENEGIKAS